MGIWTPALDEDQNSRTTPYYRAMQVTLSLAP